ncbi:MAG: crossover junction endodeoxyribonuclease RuvC [Deltaproteobacteria bacterium RIFCSPLOWO2_02_FULL_44_10]|nr:MAG: crossover junction endodeoxyribonuclease RuvC [Deltaproteobacteria bacterium RIFCSPHIGHO2_02_FULL_44_16]OGQ46031.1 MAG: crossover junction endodeoxyribonuclease RuvC [Deltaproteobacteria bacterium RIFCSPLOWO2_02_FULL_44_10]
MIILGIDPGSRTTGYGLVSVQGKNIEHVDNGSISPSHTSLPQRLQYIYDALTKLIQEYRPDVMALEEIFVAHNVRSAMVLGHARGVAMLCAVNARLILEEYSAREVKQAVVGFGTASKLQIQQMTKSLLKLPEIAAVDAADALAVALCHGQSQHLKERIKKAGGA